ncbi:MAG TPA: MerR family transcriptional regulator [Pseudobacteroides sp.]|uniref:helix-turn-helix domain-containing protein n=1 Tax=Pseudobacteroides sp. TaxID=1968840 RepID=UPI002F91F23E
MTISEAIKETGLTKRAIRFYEEEGLINPAANPENGYRNFSSKDIDRLIKISLLRQLGLSIDNIKELINSPDSIIGVLTSHLDKIDKTIKTLEKSKDLINEIIADNNIKNSNDFMTKLKSLRDHFEYEDKTKSGYVKRQLLKIFPGSFGKMLILHFSPFLNDPIDSKDKEKAWGEIVSFLDKSEPFKYPDEFGKNLDCIPEDTLLEIAKEQNKEIQAIINYTPQELEEYKTKIIDSIRSLNQNKEFIENRQKTWQTNLDLKNSLLSEGYYDRFVRNLRIISSDYDKYQEILNKLNADLGLYYDETGNIQIPQDIL